MAKPLTLSNLRRLPFDLLILATAASAVSLSDFAPRCDGLTPACSAIYFQDIANCAPTDFTAMSGDAAVCSPACISALSGLQDAVSTACSNDPANDQNIVNQFMGGKGVGALCPGGSGGGMQSVVTPLPPDSTPSGMETGSQSVSPDSSVSPPSPPYPSDSSPSSTTTTSSSIPFNNPPPILTASSTTSIPFNNPPPILTGTSFLSMVPAPTLAVEQPQAQQAEPTGCVPNGGGGSLMGDKTCPVTSGASDAREDLGWRMVYAALVAGLVGVGCLGL